MYKLECNHPKNQLFGKHKYLAVQSFTVLQKLMISPQLCSKNSI